MNVRHKTARNAVGAALLAACFLMLLSALLPALRPPERTAYTSVHGAAEVKPIALQTGEVMVNLADAEALTALPGIGPVLAQAIVDEREAHGAFFYPEDLLAVKGIGEKRLDALRDLLDMEEVSP